MTAGLPISILLFSYVFFHKVAVAFRVYLRRRNEQYCRYCATAVTDFIHPSLTRGGDSEPSI
jgi:hypothetical protein